MTLTHQASSPQEPPTCDTGALFTTPPQTPVFGWFRFTSKHKALIPDLLQYWSAISGDKWELTDRGLFGYQESYRSAFGASVNFTHDRSEFCADFRQSTLGSIPLPEAHAFFQYCDALLEAKATRFDAAIDDFSENITKEKIDAALLQRNHRTRSKEIDLRKSYTRASWTLYVGSRNSTKFVRIYNKAAESNLPTPVVRVEGEYKDSSAELCFRRVVESRLDDIIHLFRGLLRGVIDFVDREADSNISRCPLLEWWEKFLDDATKVLLPTPEKPKNIERVFHWMQRQWIGTVAMIREIYGLDSLQEFIAKLSRDHDGQFSLAQRLIIETELATMP